MLDLSRIIVFPLWRSKTNPIPIIHRDQRILNSWEIGCILPSTTLKKLKLSTSNTKTINFSWNVFVEEILSLLLILNLLIRIKCKKNYKKNLYKNHYRVKISLRRFLPREDLLCVIIVNLPSQKWLHMTVRRKIYV